MSADHHSIVGCSATVNSVPVPSITTKKGDRGETHLHNNYRVSKTDDRIEAIGQVELTKAYILKVQAELTLVASINDKFSIQKRVLKNATRVLNHAIENLMTLPDRQDLVRSVTDTKRLMRNRFYNALITTIEVEAHSMEKYLMEKHLPPLKKFFVPITNFSTNLARAQVRSTERWLLHIENQRTTTTVDMKMCVFLNRFGDYLFVLSHYMAYIFERNKY